jgi:tRNA A-37 threonylcarbamoyl transferase component Bud32
LTCVQHLDDNAASEFVSGALSPSAFGRVEAHLASCRDCRALVAALAGDLATDSVAATFQRAPAPAPSELPRRPTTSGDRIGRYLVLSPLGAGGMGVVFAAWDPQLGRKIALKLLRTSVAMSSKDARSRLRREAQAIAQLSHPHVVSIYDVGTTEDGALYIAMEFVEGDTLTSWLRAYPRTWREILDVFRQAARGLLAAHSVGLLHRDFKPDNVLVGGDGRVRVTDFGLARSVLLPEEVSQVHAVGAIALDAALTATGTVLGTPRYMPPEQLMGPDLDARSDQFSFCVALYEALYGRHPLPGGTSVRMLDHGERALAPPAGSTVPAALGRAVLRGLERDRARRFPSMGALIDELEVRPRSRSPLRTPALIAAATLLIGGTTAAVVVQQRAPSEQPTDFTTIHELAVERDRQEVKVQRLTEERDQANAQIARLQGGLAAAAADNDAKDAEIARLSGVAAKATSELKIARAQMARMAGPAIASDPDDPALIAIRGCFLEWDDRNRGTRDDTDDATIVAVVTITPTGAGTKPRIVRTPDEHPAMPDGEAPGMSLLEMCVSDQVTRIRYPASSEELEVEETIHWAHGSVALSPRIIGRRQVPLRRIELP